MKDLQMDAKLAFSENLKRIRKEKGLTQENLEEKSGISQSALSQLEKGNTWPDHNTVSILAKALKCKQTDLFKEAK